MPDYLAQRKPDWRDIRLKGAPALTPGTPLVRLCPEGLGAVPFFTLPTYISETTGYPVPNPHFLRLPKPASARLAFFRAAKLKSIEAKNDY